MPTPSDVDFERLDNIIEYLLGESDLDGHWYGDGHVKDRPFWWRSDLRKNYRNLKQSHDDLILNSPHKTK